MNPINHCRKQKGRGDVQPAMCVLGSNTPMGWSSATQYSGFYGLRTYWYIHISIVRIPYKTLDEFHPDFFHIGYTLIKWFCITVNVGIFI